MPVRSSDTSANFCSRMAFAFDLLILRIVVRVAHHGLDRRKQGRRILRLRGLDEIHAVSLVPVGVQVFIDARHYGGGLGIFLRPFTQKVHQELGGRHDDEVGQFFMGANPFGNLEEIPVCLHGFRLDSREKLTADVVVIGQMVLQEIL